MGATKKGEKEREYRVGGGARRLFKASAVPADLFTNIGQRTAGTERVFPQK